MKAIGIVMWAGGLLLAAYAGLIFEPTINGSTVNFDLQQRQMMLLIVGCVLFAVGVVLHAISAKLPDHPSREKEGLRDQRPSTARLAYALELGITDTDAGYMFDGKAFASLEDAIRAAAPHKQNAMPDFGKVGW